MSFKHHFIALAMLALPLVSQAQKVVPTSVGTGTGTRWTFTTGPIAMQTGAKNAGRIFSVTYNGANMLHMDTANNNSGSNTNYGNTFWPTPQAAWKTSTWPPSVNIDGSGAYTATYGSDTTLVLNGQSDANNSVRINKQYWVNAKDTSINYHYTLINTATSAKSWGPWEDTRIDSGGIYLFPKGTGGKPTDTITGDIAPFVKDSNGILWYRHNAANQPTKACAGGACKFYADGSEGWYAHVTAAHLVLIKKFTDTPYSQKAPGVENEVELYSSSGTGFIEMEAQGPYTSIAANDSIQWDMKWYIRKLPDSIAVTVGNPAIAAYVRSVIGGPVSVNGRVGSAAAAGNGFRLGSAGNRVSIDMDKGADVSLSIVSSNGREISLVHSGRLSHGHHDFALTNSMPKGVYWLVLKDAVHPGIVGMSKLIWLQN